MNATTAEAPAARTTTETHTKTRSTHTCMLENTPTRVHTQFTVDIVVAAAAAAEQTRCLSGGLPILDV